MQQQPEAKSPLFSLCVILFICLSASMLFLLTATRTINVFSYLSLSATNLLLLLVYFFSSVAPASFIGFRSALRNFVKALKVKFGD